MVAVRVMNAWSCWLRNLPKAATLTASSTGASIDVSTIYHLPSIIYHSLPHHTHHRHA
jgi:hypothetical protein